VLKIAQSAPQRHYKHDIVNNNSIINNNNSNNNEKMTLTYLLAGATNDSKTHTQDKFNTIPTTSHGLKQSVWLQSSSLEAVGYN